MPAASNHHRERPTTKRFSRGGLSSHGSTRVRSTEVLGVAVCSPDFRWPSRETWLETIRYLNMDHLEEHETLAVRSAA